MTFSLLKATARYELPKYIEVHVTGHAWTNRQYAPRILKAYGSLASSVKEFAERIPSVAHSVTARNDHM
jgi:hypothetical protein